MKSKEYKICQRCVMDTTDPHILFDKNGYCNHCTDNIKSLKYVKQKSKSTDDLLKEVNKIKIEHFDQEYDCVIGLSGGVDSSYLAYYVTKVLRLRPLAVHLDNGWNSKLAVKNIKNCVKSLNIDLFTHVIQWEEFKEMQLAYLKASVIDIEVLTDHAISAILYKVAQKNHIKYIFTGLNPATERILPKSWAFNKNDLLNLRDIVTKHSNVNIESFPTLGEKLFKKYAKSISQFVLFEYIDFNLSEAIDIISKELKWQPYGGKHYESTWTRFYQGYILYEKFKIDKRRAHLSSQICLNEISRAKALLKLETKPYKLEQIDQDIEYVCKKFGLTLSEFKDIMSLPVNSHFDYKSNLKSYVLKKIMVPTNLTYKIYKRFIKSHSFGQNY